MNILFVGAGGAGMGGLVQWHSALGNTVYLQDDGATSVALLQKYPQGIMFDPQITVTFDRVVFSDAIPTHHPLRSFAHENKIPVRSYAQELGALSEGRNLVAIAG